MTKILEYRVSKETNAASLGSAISRAFTIDGCSAVDLATVGPFGVNVCMKSLCYANEFLGERGCLTCTPQFGKFATENGERTRMLFRVVMLAKPIQIEPL